MSYTVNTKVTLHPVVISSPDNMLTVLTFVDSKSNYSESRLQYITNETTFNYYFNDKYTEYSESLWQANRVLNFGYNVLACNVRTCKYKESARIFNNNGEYISSWFDCAYDVQPQTTILHDTDNLAIKFKIKDLKDKYLLLEHLIRGNQANCYVGIFKGDIPAPVVNQLNYIAGSTYEYNYDDNQTEEENAQRLINILSHRESYTCTYTPDGYVHLMYPYEFFVPEDYQYESPQRVFMEYDEVFLAHYLNNTKYNNRVLDIFSKYNSDLEDLAVEFYKQLNKYCITVYKFQNGNNIIDTETYTSEDLNALFEAVEYNSKYITIKRFTEEFPIGKFYLEQKHEEIPVTFEDYLTAIDSFTEILAEGYSIAANLILEPDLNITKEQEVELQKHINTVFSDVSNMYIKLFNYIGETDNKLSCYFDTSTFLYKTTQYNTKMLVLKMLVSGSRIIQLNRIVKLTEGVQEDQPYYVNSGRVGFEYVNFQRIKLLLANNLYDIFDMLVISCVNSQTSKEDGKSRFYFYDLIERLTTYFTNHFGYDPNLYIKTYTEDRSRNQAYVAICYTPSDMSEIRTIDLLLDLYGENENG